MQQWALGRDITIVYNNQQQLTRICSFQEDFVVLQVLNETMVTKDSRL